MEYQEEYSSQTKVSNKKFWSFVKNLKRDNTGVAHLKDKGVLTVDPTAKADILNRQYQACIFIYSGMNIKV